MMTSWRSYKSHPVMWHITWKVLTSAIRCTLLHVDISSRLMAMANLVIFAKFGYFPIMYFQLHTSILQEITVLDEKFFHEVKGQCILEIFYAACLEQLWIIKPQNEGVKNAAYMVNFVSFSAARSELKIGTSWKLVWRWRTMIYTNCANFKKIDCLISELKELLFFVVMTS